MGKVLAAGGASADRAVLRPGASVRPHDNPKAKQVEKGADGGPKHGTATLWRCKRQGADRTLAGTHLEPNGHGHTGLTNFLTQNCVLLHENALTPCG